MTLLRTGQREFLYLSGFFYRIYFKISVAHFGAFWKETVNGMIQGCGLYSVLIILFVYNSQIATICYGIS